MLLREIAEQRSRVVCGEVMIFHHGFATTSTLTWVSGNFSDLQLHSDVVFST